MYIYVYIIYRSVWGYPPGGIFGPYARLSASGCGVWQLLARRRRRRRDSRRVPYLGNSAGALLGELGGCLTGGTWRASY